MLLLRLSLQPVFCITAVSSTHRLIFRSLCPSHEFLYTLALSLVCYFSCTHVFGHAHFWQSFKPYRLHCHCHFRSFLFFLLMSRLLVGSLDCSGPDCCIHQTSLKWSGWSPCLGVAREVKIYPVNCLHFVWNIGAKYGPRLEAQVSGGVEAPWHIRPVNLGQAKLFLYLFLWT